MQQQLNSTVQWARVRIQGVVQGHLPERPFIIIHLPVVSCYLNYEFVSLVSVVQSKCVRPFFASTESQESKSGIIAFISFKLVLMIQLVQIIIIYLKQEI